MTGENVFQSSSSITTPGRTAPGFTTGLRVGFPAVGSTSVRNRSIRSASLKDLAARISVSFSGYVSINSLQNSMYFFWKMESMGASCVDILPLPWKTPQRFFTLFFCYFSSKKRMPSEFTVSIGQLKSLKGDPWPFHIKYRAPVDISK